MNAKPTKRRGNLPFSAETQAAILRLYVEQRLSGRQTADKLHLDVAGVQAFLRQGGVMRPYGFSSCKLTPTQREQLSTQLPTTPDVVLARQYGVSRERVRQIRQQLGYASSRVLQKAAVARAREERRERQPREQEQARQLREQQQRAAQLPVLNRLSERWNSGATLPALAMEYGVTVHCLAARIRRGRILYPEKFARRFNDMGPAWKRGVEKLWQEYWRTAVPDVDRLSRQWRDGATVKQLAREYGIHPYTMHSRIKCLRKRFPAKFPCRHGIQKRDDRGDDTLNSIANRRK